nr:FtsX-like permease family protein [uncultured Sphaerochaeta sp.]
MRLLLRLATRYAFSRQNRHRGTSVRISLGLALCLFAIVAVLSFMQALQRNQFEDIRTFESFDLQIDLESNDYIAANEAATLIEGLDSVQHAFVYVDIPVIAQGTDGSTIAGRLRGIDGEGRFLSNLNSYRGFLFQEGQIAVSYSNTRSIDMGETLTLTFLKKGKQATVVPSRKELEVGAVYYTTSYDFDHSTFLCDVETLLALQGDVPLKIGVFTLQDVKEVKAEIMQMGFPNTSTWMEINASLYGAMELEQKMMALMLFLMVLVILVHIRNSSRRLLLAKQTEIAMLRAIGLTKAKVQALFVLQAVVVAVIGSLVGVVLSYVGIAIYPTLSSYVYRSMGVHLELEIRSVELLVLFIVIVAFSLLASFHGTHKILKADIMEMFAHDEVN